MKLYFVTKVTKSFTKFVTKSYRPKSLNKYIKQHHARNIKLNYNNTRLNFLGKKYKQNK